MLFCAGSFKTNKQATELFVNILKYLDSWLLLGGKRNGHYSALDSTPGYEAQPYTGRTRPASPQSSPCPIAPHQRPIGTASPALGASEFVAPFKTPLLFRSMILGTFHLKDPQEVSLGKVMKV